MYDKDMLREIIEGQFLNLYQALAKRAPKIHVFLKITPQMKEDHPFLCNYTSIHATGIEFIILNIGTEAGKDMHVEDAFLYISLAFSRIQYKLVINLLDVVWMGIPGQKIGFNTNGIWVATEDPTTTGYHAITAIVEDEAIEKNVTPAKRSSHLTVVK